MIMADVLKIVFLILGFLLSFNAYWLLGAGLFPHTTGRAARCFQCCPVRITIFGLLLLAPLITLGLVVMKSPQPFLKIVGGVVVFVPLLVALLGSAGLCQHIGTGLLSSMDETQPWRRVYRGGLVLALSFLMPVIGWFIVLPLALAGGFGAGLAAIFAGKKLDAPVQPPL